MGHGGSGASRRIEPGLARPAERCERGPGTLHDLRCERSAPSPDEEAPLLAQDPADGAFELWREPGPNGCGPRILIASGNVRDLGRIVSDTDAISSDALVEISGYGQVA